MTSHSNKPKDIKLLPYEFDPKDLNQLVKDAEGIDPHQDMKAAKKARTALKKKISDIKKVHTANKRIILDFKRDMEAYDLSKMEFLIQDISKCFDALNLKIETIENKAKLEAQRINGNIIELENNWIRKILDTTTKEDMIALQKAINDIPIDDKNFGDRKGEADSIKTSLILKASGRAQEIANAGGSLKPSNAKPIDTGVDTEKTLKYTDTELLNFLQSAGSAQGWVVNVSPHTGIQVFQSADSNIKDVRVAIAKALEQHDGI